MSQGQIAETEFSRRLRAELTAIVAERATAGVVWTPAPIGVSDPTWRRRGSRLGLVAVAAAAVAALVLIFSAGGSDTSSAFAVETQGEGTVSVEILSFEDASGLEAALGEAGIPASVTYLASGMACKEPRFQAAPWPAGTRSIVTAQGNGEGPIGFSVSREAVAPGQTLVITASSKPEAIYSVHVDLAEGAVAPCEPVQTPATPNQSSR